MGWGGGWLSVCKISHTTGNNNNAFWIYNDRPINKLALFVLNRFHKDHQEGKRLLSLYLEDMHVNFNGFARIFHRSCELVYIDRVWEFIAVSWRRGRAFLSNFNYVRQYVCSQQPSFLDGYG